MGIGNAVGTRARFSLSNGAEQRETAAGRLTILPREFYARPVLQVARDCIGMYLMSYIGGCEVVGRIVETEAYDGPEDRAAHSYSGRRTPRTEVMFGPAGFAYVFMLYGIHYNFNLVTGNPGQPQAVLVRAVEPLTGRNHMAMRRSLSELSPLLSNGPGKLCQALGINKTHYGEDLTRGVIRLAYGPACEVNTSARVGIDYAGEWAHKPWRFYEANNPHVSKARTKP